MIVMCNCSERLERHVPTLLLLHYQESAGVRMASSNRKDLLSCTWVAEHFNHT